MTLGEEEEEEGGGGEEGGWERKGERARTVIKREKEKERKIGEGGGECTVELVALLLSQNKDRVKFVEAFHLALDLYALFIARLKTQASSSGCA